MTAADMTRRQALQAIGLALASLVGAVWAWAVWWRMAMSVNPWSALDHPGTRGGWYGPSHHGEVAWFWPRRTTDGLSWMRLYMRRRKDWRVQVLKLPRYILDVAWAPRKVGPESWTWQYMHGWERTWG